MPDSGQPEGGYFIRTEWVMVRDGMPIDITDEVRAALVVDLAPNDPNRIKPKKGDPIEVDRHSDASGCPTGR